MIHSCDLTLIHFGGNFKTLLTEVNCNTADIVHQVAIFVILMQVTNMAIGFDVFYNNHRNMSVPAAMHT